MEEYITKEQAQETVRNTIVNYIPILIGRTEKIPLELAIAIRDIPTEDVTPVIHAKWEKDKLFGDCAYVCTFCYTIWTSSEIDNMHYCPTCGAKMDKE